MNNERTILITTPYFPPQGGGLERYALQIANRLHERYNWHVVMVASGEHHGKEVVKKDMNGITVYLLPYQCKISNTPFSFKWRGQIKNILLAEKPHIINVQMPVPGIGDITASLAGEIPVVVTYHAGTMRKRKFIPDVAIWIYEHWTLRSLLRRAKYITCSSDFVRNDFLAHYQSKSVTITPGVDIQRFIPGQKISAHPTLLFVAGLSRAEQHKGLQVLIGAFNQLHKEIPELRLVVVGEGNMKKEYEDRVHALGLENNVTFRGRLEKDELVEAYQQSDIFVLPSLSPAESFGMVLIEAMAVGNVVIGSKAGGIPLVIDDNENGLLVNSGDQEALVNAIKNIINDPVLAARLSQNGKEKAKTRYDWDKQAADYNELLMKI